MIDINFDPIFDPVIEEINYERMEDCPQEQLFYIAIYRYEKSNYWHVLGCLFDNKEDLIKGMKRYDDVLDLKILTVSLPSLVCQ